MPGPGSPLPVVPVLSATTATQAFSTLGILALAAVAPRAATDIGVSAALIGYQVGFIFFAAAFAALLAGGLVRRFGPVRTSQLSLWLVASGCVGSAFGSIASLAGGAMLMGLGYGITNPAASQLLARLPTARSMNLIFSIKQTGVPIGGVLSGVVVPPLTVAWGWQPALVTCAIAILVLSAAIGVFRREWDSDREPGAPMLASARASVAIVWKHKPLRWLAGGSFLYSGTQLCLSGFLVTYLVADVGLNLVAAGSLLAVTNAAGAFGRLFWGWLADRVGSGGIALMANGALSMAGALATAALTPAWPLWAVAVVVAAFGFCAMGWNGVFIAVIVRQAPPGGIGFATGGSLSVTYAGIVVMPPAFAALHDQWDVSYGAGFALLALVTAAGIACVVQARRWRKAMDSGPPS